MCGMPVRTQTQWPLVLAEGNNATKQKDLPHATVCDTGTREGERWFLICLTSPFLFLWVSVCLSKRDVPATSALFLFWWFFTHALSSVFASCANVWKNEKRADVCLRVAMTSLLPQRPGRSFTLAIVTQTWNDGFVRVQYSTGTIVIWSSDLLSFSVMALCICQGWCLIRHTISIQDNFVGICTKKHFHRFARLYCYYNCHVSSISDHFVLNFFLFVSLYATWHRIIYVQIVKGRVREGGLCVVLCVVFLLKTSKEK